VTNLNYGDHSVEYNTIPWWQEPEDEIIKIENSTLRMESRAWTKIPEPLAITTILEPAGAVAAGAKWVLNGVSYDSGQSVPVSAGDYTISYSDVSGWLSPLDSVTSVTNGSETVTGVYYRVDIIGGDGDGDLAAPRGVALRGDYIYITDSDNHRVQIYNKVTHIWTPLGGHGSGLGQFERPFGIIAAPNGDLWIADTGNHRIQRYASATGVWASLGSYGTAAGQFNAPYDLDMDSNGNVYVADYHNSRVQKMTPAGIWSVIVTSGSEEGRVRFPSGITIDQNDNIYVSDYDPAGAGEAGRIQKFNSAGDFLMKVGGEQSGQGGFNQNMGLGVAAGKQLVAANTFDNEVLALGAGGVWNTVIARGVLDMPRDVDVDIYGNIAVADTGNNRVMILPAAAASFIFGSGSPSPQMMKLSGWMYLLLP
jgi:sugar lactone lactonase YvrE